MAGSASALPAAGKALRRVLIKIAIGDSDQINFRFCPLCGPKSDISQGQRSATTELVPRSKTSEFAPSSSWTRVDQFGNFLEVRDRITRTRRLGEQVELLILSFPDRHQRQVCVGLRLGRKRDHRGGDRKPADCPGQKRVQLECLPNIAWPKDQRVLARQAWSA